MDRKTLLEHLRKALQRESQLTEDMELSSVEEWDSMAILSTMLLYDQLFSAVIDIGEVNKCGRVSDLLDLVSEKLT